MTDLRERAGRALDPAPGVEDLGAEQIERRQRGPLVDLAELPRDRQRQEIEAGLRACGELAERGQHRWERFWRVFTGWSRTTSVCHPSSLHVDPYIVLGSAIIGLLVGMTGAGGGALMTPMLILLFGVTPSAAISSDLVAAVVMRPIGAGCTCARGTVNRGSWVGW